MKIQRFMTWPLAVTLAGVAGLIIVALAPQTAEAVRVFRFPDLVCVDKTVDPGLVVEGVANQLTYVVTVRNSGNRTANDVVVTDTLPPELGGTAAFVSATPSVGTCDPPNGTLTCNLGNMAAGAEETVTIVIDVTPAAGNTFRNFASVSTSSTESNTGNNGGAQSSCDVQVVTESVGTPNLVCRSKTAIPPTLEEGVSANVLYTVTIDNTGSATATGVSVADTMTSAAALAPTFVSSNNPGDCGGFSAGTPLPSGTVLTCDLADIDPGGTGILQITVNIPTPGATETYTDSAVASATDTADSNVCPVTVTVVAGGNGGGEGCTPGGWRNHLGAWPPTGLSPDDDFDTIFGVDLFDPDKTLNQTIRLGGGGVRKLARHGTACLLNAASPGVDYDLTEEQCIDIIRTGSSNGLDIDDVVFFNEQGCSVF